MKAFCPNCEKETVQRFIDRIEEFDIRGEMIPVQVNYYHCEECGEDYDLPNSNDDPLDQAYREFRKRKGMVQPDEIRKFRKEMKLTQKEWSDILGIGIATLSRYENGALQSEAHDKIIRMYMRPENLLQILNDEPALLSEQTREGLLQLLRNNDQSCDDFLERTIEKLFDYPPSLANGFIQFNEYKLFQSIKFFCFKDQVSKTKLLKLLFYADFKHFKDNGVSITGTQYAHASLGPVPHQFRLLMAIIIDRKKLITSTEQIFGEHVGEVYQSDEPDWSIFSTSELASLAFVKNKFQHYSARQIRDFSHQEKGWKETGNGEPISYKYAQDLQI